MTLPAHLLWFRWKCVEKIGRANGRVAAALMAKAGDLLAKPPAILKLEVLADKLPK